ncbi:MAG: shikimate kinase [Thermoanaerobaculales bacterium]|nr:shikimate kinase [Thermoanaerobaculales bacterium]
MQNVYLVGFMGAGKTAVGQVLAGRLDRVFFDMDKAIEARAGMPISEIFATRGEAAFRMAEDDEVEMTTDRKGLVVATGGGAFTSRRNRQLIHGSGGVSVFLDPPWETIRRRLAGATSSRPKWVDDVQARGLYDARMPTYLMATVHIDLAGDEDPNETADRIVDALEEITCGS